MRPIIHWLATAVLISTLATRLSSAEVCGVTVTPHVVADSMMYRRPRYPDLAAKVQLFVKGAALPSSFNGKTPSELLETGEWAWHEFGTTVQGAEDSLSVWTWNGKSSRWDTYEWLPKIHAVEFLGEPQYGGGRPVAPQEVFEKLLPYRTSRLATSVTNSEELFGDTTLACRTIVITTPIES